MLLVMTCTSVLFFFFTDIMSILSPYCWKTSICEGDNEIKALASVFHTLQAQINNQLSAGFSPSLNCIQQGCSIQPHQGQGRSVGLAWGRDSNLTGTEIFLENNACFHTFD